MTGHLLPSTDVGSLSDWRTLGGGTGLDAALRLGPADTCEEVLAAGLRGRGGAGFPTGRKWQTVRGLPGTHRYLVVNGAEGEPATFKDRAILRANPYQVVEGAAIAAFAIGARQVYVGVKSTFTREIERLRKALVEMQEEGLAGDVPITIVEGPDEYLFGEEKGLLEVIEGRPPMPRSLPTYEHGLFAVAPQMGWDATSAEPGNAAGDQSNPTAVNNVETLANVAHILARGATWYRSMGTDASPGTVVATIVGDVAHPDVGEVELGTPLGDVIDAVGGGAHAGRTVKAVLPGVANPVITADRLGTPLTYEDMSAAGSGMGAAGFAVYDDTACMAELTRVVSRFLWVESCGQCPACKLGSGEITERLEAVVEDRGSDHDIATIGSRLPKVTDSNRCGLGMEERLIVSSMLKAFPAEFAAHLEGRCTEARHDLVIPKLVDLAGGVATYDTRHARKRPDWTYAEQA